MKKFLILMLTLVLAAGNVQAGGKKSIRVMTFNVLQGKGEPQGREWKTTRRTAAVKMIKEINPDIIGTQEARKSQCKDLQLDLAQYGQVKFPKDSIEKNGGQRTMILYRKERFKMVEWGKYWFSEDLTARGNRFNDPKTTQKLSVWVKLYDKNTKKDIYVFDAHFFAKVSKIENRQVCAQITRDQILKIVPKGATVFFMGDLNTNYETSYDCLDPLKQIMENAALAARKSDGPQKPTYNRFGKGKPSTLDYIFFRGAKADTYRVIHDTKYGTDYISDHWPVYADFTLK